MVSHAFQRIFQPQKIMPPRGFEKPNIEALQAQSMPLWLEIGAGKGKHALVYAMQNPQHQLFAIERTKEKFCAFAKAYEQACYQKKPLANLMPIHADAIAWAVHALPSMCLDGVFILYPNPEPNNANQRWLNMPFFEFLLSRLKPNATVILATNIESYAQEAFNQATQVWQLPIEKSNVPKGSERTHFEVKYLARGEECWQLTMTKPENYQTRFDSF